MARFDTRAGQSSGTTVAAGAGAGITAGVLMALFLMVYAGAMMGNVWAPLQLLGATFYGPAALESGAGIMLWGLVVHVVTSAVLGVVFAAVVGPRTSGGAALGWGVLFGLLVLVAMTFLILPWANPTMFARVQQMTGAWIAAHVIYGMGLALAPGWIRRSEPRYA